MWTLPREFFRNDRDKLLLFLRSLGSLNTRFLPLRTFNNDSEIVQISFLTLFLLAEYRSGVRKFSVKARSAEIFGDDFEHLTNQVFRIESETE